MKKLLFFLVLVFVLAGCASTKNVSQDIYRSPQTDYKISSSLPTQSTEWPRLKLTGANPAKVSLVYSAFVQRGWPINHIAIHFTGSQNSVKAEILGGGDVDVPTTDKVLSRGLCETQRAAIQGLIDRYRPKIFSSVSVPQNCPGGKCFEKEGLWKGIPPVGTKTATINNGYYGNFEVVYDSTKKCPAIQQWRNNPSDFASEHKKIWFRDKAMAETWLLKGILPSQLDAKLANATFQPASIGYQKWIELEF